MNERLIMISDYLSGDYSISQLARRRGVSRKTAYKWIERYEADPAHGLEELSRAAHHHPNAISQQMEGRILEWKAKYPLWGAPKIHSKLIGSEDCPAESTVSNVLARHGLTRPVRRRARATPSLGPLSDPGGANQMWCVDFKGWFRLGNGQRCDPLTMSDGYSRYLICCQGFCNGTGNLVVRPVFERTFRENGVPEKIRSDNGTPFASVGLAGLSVLSVWWLQLGIKVERIQPGHPEQNGRHERMHRTLKEATATRPSWNLQGQQKRFDAFRQEYNEQRPHEALGQQPPASRYAPSVRPYPERLIEPQYADDWQKRRVRINGAIVWKGCELYVSQALSGQWVGLEPVGDGLWQMHFMSLELGMLDERRNRVQPLPTQPKESNV